MLSYEEFRQNFNYKMGISHLLTWSETDVNISNTRHKRLSINLNVHRIDYYSRTIAKEFLEKITNMADFNILKMLIDALNKSTSPTSFYAIEFKNKVYLLEKFSLIPAKLGTPQFILHGLKYIQ